MSKIKIGNKINKKFKVLFDEIKNFSNLTKDMHLLHRNKIFANSKGFEDVVVNGAYISSLAIGLVAKKFINQNGLLRSMRFKFIKPLIINKNFRILAEVVSINDRHKILNIIVTVMDHNNNKNIFATGSIEIKQENNL